jgi:hypothetical protein
MRRRAFGVLVALGALLIFPAAALADNCSSPGDCWRTGAAGAAAAAGAGAVAGAAAAGAAGGRNGNGGDPDDPNAPPVESGDEPDDNPCD